MDCATVRAIQSKALRLLRTERRRREMPWRKEEKIECGLGEARKAPSERRDHDLQGQGIPGFSTRCARVFAGLGAAL
jgi:hypothetical protein